MAGTGQDPGRGEAARPTLPADHRETVPPAEEVYREGVRLPDQRGGAPRRPARRRHAPLPVAAAVASVWAALASYLPVAAGLVLVATAGGESSAPGALRVAAAGWLLAHGVALETAAGPLGLVPLAVAVLAAWRVSHAGVHVTRAMGARRSGSVPAAFAAGVAVAIGYGGIGALAAALAAGPGMAVAPWRAGLTLAVFAFLAGSLGALRCTGSLLVLGLRTPRVLRDGMRTGLVAVLVLLGAGAALAGVALALSGGPASDVLAAYRTGVAGQAGIALICAAYAPNLAAWAAAYLVGPGFAVGAGTGVSATSVTLGALPAIPLFAALPSGPLPMGGTLLLGAPLVAGMVAGWLLASRRRGRGVTDWGGLVGAALVTGPVAGVLLGLAAVASSGALGGGRLASIGPAPLPVALVGAGVIAVGALLGGVVAQSFAPAAADRARGRERT
uniref:cell division protein PerM n=1 Tax=Rhizomonospora bruguierae TaxID=1581705 RepID=UPI0020BEA8B4|nr:DUF6350 family protein [Micromonospora sp. NBRC 107566]